MTTRTNKSGQENGQALDVEFALEQLIFGFRREFLHALDAAGLALSPADLLALRLLQKTPGCSLQYLVQCTSRDKAQVTRQVRCLEEKGLVRRERDSEDQRSFRLYLTTRGAQFEKQARRMRRAIQRRLFSDLDAAERTQLRDLLNRCVASLRR